MIQRRHALAAALAVAVAVSLAWALTLDFLADAAFIAFRYARNLASGHGLVYNVGERVEGYSSFLFVLVLALLRGLGADIVAAGRTLSLMAGGAGVVLAWALARPGLYRWPQLAVVAAFLTGVNPYYAAWAGAGVETTLFTALLAAAVLPLLGDPPTRDRFVVVSGLALLLALTRPEGVALYAVLVALAAAVIPGEPRARARVLVPGLALFAGVGAVYFLARWAYFGDFLPNFYRARSSFTSVDARRGLTFLYDYTANPFVLVALPILGAGVWVAARRRLWPLLAVPAAILAIVVAEGGDPWPMYRFVVPTVPFAAALCALGIERVGERLGRVGLAVGSTAAALVAILSFYPNRDKPYLDYEYQREIEVPLRSAAGRALAAAYPRGTTLAVAPIGAVGYYSDLPVLDMTGATDKTIARGRVPAGGTSWESREKHDAAYVIRRQPGILLLGGVYVDPRPSLPPGGFPPHDSPAVLARDREISSQPSFARDYEQRRLAVSPGLWLHYFARRDLAKPR